MMGLLRGLRYPPTDMFQPNVTVEDQLNIAYRLRNMEIAFSPYAKEPNPTYD
jgi:hypothetical protein